MPQQTQQNSFVTETNHLYIRFGFHTISYENII